MRFEALRETLLRAGVAPRHVRRYLTELDDHLAQLVVQERAAGYGEDDALTRARALLGDDAALTAAALAQPGLRSIVARAPWAVFGLSTPFVVTLAYVVPTLLLVGLAKLHGFVAPGSANAPAWYRMLAEALAMGANLVLPLLLGTGLALLARRQRLPPHWPLLGAALIAAIAMQIHVAFPVDGQHRGAISLGALIWWSSAAHHHDGFRLALMLTQAVLVVTPVAVAPLMRRRLPD
jgi:hypothetical protein